MSILSQDFAPSPESELRNQAGFVPPHNANVGILSALAAGAGEVARNFDRNYAERLRLSAIKERQSALDKRAAAQHAEELKFRSEDIAHRTAREKLADERAAKLDAARERSAQEVSVLRNLQVRQARSSISALAEKRREQRKQRAIFNQLHSSIPHDVPDGTQPLDAYNAERERIMSSGLPSDKQTLLLKQLESTRLGREGARAAQRRQAGIKTFTDANAKVGAINSQIKVVNDALAAIMPNGAMPEDEVTIAQVKKLNDARISLLTKLAEAKANRNRAVPNDDKLRQELGIKTHAQIQAEQEAERQAAAAANLVPAQAQSSSALEAQLQDGNGFAQIVGNALDGAAQNVDSAGGFLSHLPGQFDERPGAGADKLNSILQQYGR